MNRTNIVLAIAILLVGLSGIAVAGSKAGFNVEIGSSYFFGAFGTVRNSADAVQFITCLDFGSGATCSAKNIAGTVKSCTTTNANNLAVIRGMSDSDLMIAYFNSSGECTSVRTYKGSSYAPKEL